jgi:hypothetical protein
VEIDKSYFFGGRRKGKPGRGAGGKGLWRRFQAYDVLDVSRFRHMRIKTASFSPAGKTTSTALRTSATRPSGPAP